MLNRITLAAAALASASTLIAATVGQAEVIYGLTTQNSISVIDSASPTNTLTGGVVTGLMQNENLEAIDYRPANGMLYAIGNMNNLYTIDQTTFAASLVGNFAPPALEGTSFAFDFNPAFDGGSGNPADIGRYARIISDTNDNRVVDAETGQYLGGPKTDVFYPMGDVNFGMDPNVVGIAYDNNVAMSSGTQQYGIDLNTGYLVTVANNAGTLGSIGQIGVTTFTSEGGLDISGETGTAFAVLQPGPNSQLYTVDLSTGAATQVGRFGAGQLIRDLTVVPVPEPTGLALLGGLGLLGLRRRR